jgi:hypothetical protein
MASDRTVLHVTPYVNGWEFEAVVDTKEDAVEIAKRHAKERMPSQVIVHNKDGQISDESTYGDDPASSPG